MVSTGRLGGLVIAIALLSPPLHAGWNHEEVDNPRQFAVSSLALDASGRPAAAYGEGAVYYAQFDGSWNVETVDPYGGLVGDGSLAFDDGGNPGIAYARFGEVLLARHDGIQWTTETIGPGIDPALDFDGDGLPVIAYDNSGLWLARHDGVAWSTALVDPQGGSWPSIDIDPAGNPAVAHMWWRSDLSGFSLFTLKLARFDGGSWSSESYDDDGVFGGFGPPSLEFHASGRWAIAYERFDDTLAAEVRVQLFDLVTVDRHIAGATNVGLEPSVAFAASGELAVAYHDPAMPGVRLARWDGTAFVTESVEPRGTLPELAFDASGEPLVSLFVQPELGALRLARFDAAVWQLETIDAPSDQVGEGCALAFDAGGRPALAYGSNRHRGRDVLKLARFDGTDWQLEVIDPDAQLWQSVARLAFDGVGEPTIAYAVRLPDTTWEIRLARRVGAVWRIEVVAANGYLWVGLAIDAAGEPAVVYIDADTNLLTLARYDGIAWSYEDLWAWRGAPSASLAFDDAGEPVVAYFAPGEVRLARYDGVIWSHQAFDTYTSQSGGIELLFDATGAPVIAYASLTDRWLKVATDDGSGWAIETVDPSAVAFDLDLDLQGGQRAIAYQSRGAARVALDDGSGWAIDVVELDAFDSTVAFDAGGVARVGYEKLGDLHYSGPTGFAALHRKAVSAFAPGWKAALPLTAANDDEGGGFPLDTASPGAANDPDPGEGAGLTLYHLLWEGGGEARNTLRLTRDGDGVAMTY